MTHDPASTRRWGFAVATVTLAGLALRLTGIDGPSFKIWDDFFALRLALRDFTDIARALAHQPFDAYQEFQPPLYYVIVNAFLGLGKTDAMARLAGVLAGTLTIPALYCLGARLFGRPAGLLAALLLAVNIYHIEYSQQVRNYVLFLCLATWSMHFLASWLLERSRLAPWGYWLSTALMLWTSYMSTVTVAAQAVLWLAFALAQARRRDWRSALFGQAPMLAAMALAGAAFLPWVGVYRNIYAALSGITGNVRPPVAETLSATLREFTSYYCEVLGYPEVAIPVLVLAVAGMAWALSARPRQAVVPLVWAVLTLVFVLGFNRQGLHVRTRHLIVVLPVLLLFAAYAVSLAAGRFRNPWAGVAAALVVVAALNVFNFRALPFFYRRQDDRLKDLCHTLATFKRDTVRQFFWGSNSKWFPDVNETVMNWYLPGEFKRPGQEFSREYMRAWMLYTQEAALTVASMGNVLPLGRLGSVNYALVGVVNTSPIVLDFGPDGSHALREAFQSPNSYGLLHELNNVHLDKGSASLIDLTRPGQATWAFALPPGAVLRSMRVGFSARFLADISGMPDGSVTVSAAGPDGEFTVLERFSGEKLARTQGVASKSVPLLCEMDVPEHLCRDGLRIRMEIDPGRDFAVVVLDSVTFTSRGEAGQQGALSPDRKRLENALANTLVAPALTWGQTPVPPGRPLYAFTSLDKDPRDPDRVGGAALMAEFRKAHPGLEPVLTIEDGPATYRLFDPALAGPALHVPGKYSLAPAKPDRPLRSLAAWRLAGETAVMLDAKPVSLASAGGEPGFARLGADGAGRLVLLPLFSKGEPAAKGAHQTEGIRQKADEDYLTCVDAKPCRVVYRLRAPGGVTDLVVRWYPRVSGDWRLGNFASVSVSSDGQRFERLDILRSNASGQWDGWRVPRTARKNWALPQQDIYLGFDLSGDGAQMWSSEEFPMIIEAGFRAPGFDPAPVTLEASGQGGRVQVLDAPASGFDHLLRYY